LKQKIVQIKVMQSDINELNIEIEMKCFFRSVNFISFSEREKNTIYILTIIFGSIYSR
jgi:hypothetical protein